MKGRKETKLKVRNSKGREEVREEKRKKFGIVEMGEEYGERWRKRGN